MREDVIATEEPPLAVQQFGRSLRLSLELWTGSVAEAGRQANLSRSRIYELTDGRWLRLPQVQQLVSACAPRAVRDAEVTRWTGLWQELLSKNDEHQPHYSDGGPRSTSDAADGTGAAASTADWYWPEARTGKREEASSEIWIASPDLYWDYEDAEYSALVFANILSGVRYRYLIRGTSENTARADELASAVSTMATPSSAEFRVLSEDRFFWCTEHVLFDPGSSSEVGLIVDIWSERDKSLKADIEMGRSRRALFRRQFARAWDGAAPTGTAEDSRP